MSIVAAQVGIDVAKRTLAVSVQGEKAFTVKNIEADLFDLADRLPKGSVVHLEASGGFERIVRRVLQDKGFEVRILNPLNCRRVAQAKGIKAKTDPVDARLLSDLGSFLPAGKPKAISRQRLSDLSRAIQHLQRSIAQIKLRAQLPDLHESVKQLYSHLIKDLRKLVRGLQAQFEREVKETSYGTAYELVQTVPCIGKSVARVLICELPEDFKSRRPQEIASYAGLAPIDSQSGGRQDVAHVGRGNQRIKSILFMPSLAALRLQPWAKDLYGRLRAKGKPHHVAMIAVMRRLLLRAVEVMQRETEWQETKKKP